MNLTNFLNKKSNEFLISGVIISLFMIAVLRVLDLNLEIPFSYSGDGLLNIAYIKTILETGWNANNPSLGAPFGTNLLDFPGADGFFILLIKTIGIFTNNPVLILNIFYLLSFPLVYFASLWAFRKLTINFWLSVSSALIYTCLPYHFLRGPNHLFLATYFIVPLILLLIINLYVSLECELENRNDRFKKHELLILFLTGSCGVYYGFFSLFLLAVIFLVACINKKTLILKKVLVAITVVVLSIFINLSPSIIHRIQEGPNIEVGTRSPIESEVYGLRMTQLLLPISAHRNKNFANTNHSYQNSIQDTEATSSALGIISSVGFLILMLVLFCNWKMVSDYRLVMMSRLNLALFLFTTVGGGGVLFALFFTPQFRGLNRASIFIAFLSLAALLLFLQKAIDKYCGGNQNRKLISFVLAGLLTSIALYDQIPVGAIAQDPLLENKFKHDAAFIKIIESQISPGSMIYQMPYIKFPEMPPLYHEGYNEMLVPYIQSRLLKWSFGAMRGRISDSWEAQIDSFDTTDKIRALESSGFSGILINRDACTDQCANLESKLQSVLKTIPLVSEDGRSVFLKLNPAIHPLIKPSFIVRPGKGFYAEEKDKLGNIWIWSKSHSNLMIYNFDKKDHVIKFQSKITSLSGTVLTVKDNHSNVARHNITAGSEKSLSMRFVLRPGKNSFAFSINGKETKVPPDVRKLAFRLASYQVD